MIGHFLGVLLLTSPVFSQTYAISDGLIGGKISVGTTAANGRVFVQSSSMTAIPFQVSGVDLSPFLRVERTGDVGIGVEPEANLDVMGSADSEDVALQLRNGNAYPAIGAAQITFGYNGAADRRHSIRTAHSTTTINNEIDFYLWTPADSDSALGTTRALALQTTTFGSAVHVDPVSELPMNDLTVSNGMVLGAGGMLAGSESVPSSRRWKADIGQLSQNESLAAFNEVIALDHVRFRYKSRRGPKPPLMTGLMYEDAPASIRGRGQTLSFDERLNNTELAMQELIRRLETLEGRSSR
jgi:hypothetical protein